LRSTTTLIAGSFCERPALIAVERGWRHVKSARGLCRFPPPRGPHPRPGPTVLAGASVDHPRGRERHRLHLAQHPTTTTGDGPIELCGSSRPAQIIPLRTWPTDGSCADRSSAAVAGP